MGRFPSRKSPGKQPIKKRGIKRFLITIGLANHKFRSARFGGVPLFHRTPPRKFQPPTWKLAPPRNGLATSNLRFVELCRNLPSPSLILGVLYRKRGIPKKGGGSLGFPHPTFHSNFRINYTSPFDFFRN